MFLIKVGEFIPSYVNTGGCW